MKLSNEYALPNVEKLNSNNNAKHSVTSFEFFYKINKNYLLNIFKKKTHKKNL